MLELTNGDSPVPVIPKGGVMRLRSRRLATLLALILGVTTSSAAGVQVLRIHDGDTLTISNGEKVRFLQIDTPEISPAECYGAEAHKALIIIVGKSPVTLESDSISDDKDQYGRILRYVFVGKMNVNLKLVEIGAATPYFYKGEKGKYSKPLLKAAQNAQAKKLGLWKKCPATKLEPSKPATTGLVSVASAANKSATNSNNCDVNYQGCIPPFPPDLDCTDIKRMGLAPVRVIGIDLHKFDGDGDGIGCDN
jgi:endonuclease YncB( thermonuclease family)